MIHPKTSLNVGYGVFAESFIPEGTIVYVKDSLEMEISPLDYATHSKEIQNVIEKYSYIDERGYRIISWDFAKYVNHCCNCNTMSTGYGFEIAIRDILPGEQITDEYGIFNLEHEMEVDCDQPNCRRMICPDDFDQYHAEWDEKVKKSMSKFRSVDQPLMGFLEKAARKHLEEYFKDPAAYKSVYSLRYRSDKGKHYNDNGYSDELVVGI